MIGPCLCGDTDCPTCGTAQGTREPDARGLCGETETEHYAGAECVDDDPHPIDVGDLDDPDEGPVYAGDLLDGITDALRNLPDDCGRLDSTPPAPPVDDRAVEPARFRRSAHLVWDSAIRDALDVEPHETIADAARRVLAERSPLDTLTAGDVRDAATLAAAERRSRVLACAAALLDHGDPWDRMLAGFEALQVRQ